MKHYLILLYAVLFTCIIKAQEINVIPYPLKANLTAKTCKVTSLQTISINSQGVNIEGAALLLKEKMAELGYNLSIENKSKGCILLSIDPSLSNEAYRLNIENKKVTITAADYSGIVHGIQTLLQQIRSGALYQGTVQDAPRFLWRGYLLDEARHFQGIDKVKQILDLMSYYKLNKFHWHLTDEQGWRIEIKAYPRLATIGGIGCNSNRQGELHYYTQEQIREIVNYAAQRAIEIIPEIDMPGHAGAANRAYPQYQALGAGKDLDYCFNPGKEETYTYLTNILREIMQLFPSPYIHIGGDEVSYGNKNWPKDPAISQLMEREHLTTLQQIESYFIKRMAKEVSKLGKIMIAWDDVMNNNIAQQGTVLTWWRHDKTDRLQYMLKNGYQTVLCPRLPMYLDFVQHNAHKVGRKWGGKTFCPLQDVYAFPDNYFKQLNLTPSQQAFVKGLQGNLWGELTHNFRRIDFMTFPRLLAIAESGWTKPELKDYSSFEKRLNVNYDYLRSLGIYYFDHRNPQLTPEPKGPIMVTHSTAGM